MDIIPILFLSLKISFFAVLLQTVPAFFCGYYLAYQKNRWAFVLNSLILLPMVVTPLVIGYFVLMLFQPESILGAILEKLGIEVIFNWKGAVLAVSLVSFPLYVQSIQIALSSIPQNLKQLSLLLGNSPLTTFFQVLLPLAKSGVIKGALLSFSRGMGEFGATVVVVGIIPQKTETLPTAIFRHLNIPSQENKVLILILTSVFISFFFILLLQWIEARKDYY